MDANALGQHHVREPFAAKIGRLIHGCTKINRIKRGQQSGNSRLIRFSLDWLLPPDMGGLVKVIALFCAFVAVVLWFRYVDFYHRYFFDSGVIVLADNLMRVVFVIILAWLIYAPGAGVASLLTRPKEATRFFAAERAVLGFGIGAGLWSVALLFLGLVGLYYRWVMTGLCLVVLALSAKHFAYVAAAGQRRLIAGFTGVRRGRAMPRLTGLMLLTLAALWLLLVRGLYPGGSGDYYTHYFYYYLTVLKNHSLAPNDVWYHYYYSKGSGLTFLSMLLTDPEATALPTFCCVIFAAVAMATLSARLLPGTFWPTAGALLYLLFYLVSADAEGGGEFQKPHEEVAALMTLAVWALCMERHGPSRPLLMMAAASAVAAAIATQVVGIMIGLFVGLLCAAALLRRRWREMFGYGLMTAAIASAVLGIFVLNYTVTGLANDQPINLMLRFANFARLDRWGVLPQVIAVAWIRDNYAFLTPPFGWHAFEQLGKFMRLEIIWPFLIAPIIASVVLVSSLVLARNWIVVPHKASNSFIKTTAIRLAAFTAMLAGISLLLGQDQNYSFVRLTSFFVPLLVLLAIAATAWVLSGQLQRGLNLTLGVVMPTVLLLGTLISWQEASDWGERIYATTANAIRFAIGRQSLAQAYAYADSGHSFGGINPGALAAARQVPPDTPIWSTNVDSYCMVPGCLIESVISFKMSGRLDEILAGDPDLAKHWLQQAGLNYFLFMSDYRLIDLLPYSRLFAPDTIGRYLGIKWTDGSTFLLTWIGADTRPIDHKFLVAYQRRLAQPENQWFMFRELTPQLIALTPRMRSGQWSRAEDFPWRHPPIDVIAATYGSSCSNYRPKPPFSNTFRVGNATQVIRRLCFHEAKCDVLLDVATLGDPANGCGKDFSVEYRCRGGGPPVTIEVPAEADGKTIVLDCSNVPASNVP
jgi:hypothetical protein